MGDVAAGTPKSDRSARIEGLGRPGDPVGGRARRTGSIALVGAVGTMATVASGAGFLAVSQSPAAAARTFTVNTLDDNYVETRGCTDVGSEFDCTLRSALAVAMGGDTIVFADGLSGTITLDAESGALESVIGGSESDSTLRIVGPGAESITIDAAGASRVFYLYGNCDVSVTVSGLTFANGSVNGDGGAIQAVGLYDVTFRDVAVTGSNAISGGAVAASICGTLDFDRVEISGNSADGAGGAIYADAAELGITGSIISGNSAIAGGAVLFAGGTISVGSSVIESNSALYWGGGLYVANADVVLVQNSTFRGNTAVGGGGAIDLDMEGSGTSATITGCLFDSNESTDSMGGAIAAFDSNNVDLSIANSTFVDNYASLSGGAISTGSDTDLDIVMSTIVNNYSNGTGGIVLDATGSPFTGSTTISGSIISMNGSFDLDAADIGFWEPQITPPVTNVANPAAIAVSPFSGIESINLDHSIVNEIDGSLIVLGSGNIFSGDPGLIALADNGGATMTMALQSDSVALDAGPDPVPTFPGSSFDQRGTPFARVSGSRSDIGAFEVQVEPDPTTSMTVPDSTTTLALDPTTTTSGEPEVIPEFTG